MTTDGCRGTRAAIKRLHQLDSRRQRSHRYTKLTEALASHDDEDCTMNTEAKTATVVATATPGWRHWISRCRRGWWLVGVAVILAGGAWDWPAAIWALPVLLALLPCAAICALGLCKNRKSGGTCDQSKTGTMEKPT